MARYRHVRFEAREVGALLGREADSNLDGERVRRGRATVVRVATAKSPYVDPTEQLVTEVVVRDIKRSVAFYRSLGFELLRDELVTISEPEGDATFQWILARR